MTAPYRCPTSCDEDCEINGWGCHECHDVPSHREHDPGACEARMLEANLRALLDGGRAVVIGKHDDGDPVVPWYTVVFGEGGGLSRGVSLGDVIAHALKRRVGLPKDS